MLVRDQHTRSALAGMKRFLVGGEALPPELAAELCASVGGSVHNMYGPTETTVWSTTWTVEAGARSVAIGRPLANTRLYVLDEAGEPVPTGIPGELFIGGDGVARGYWNQPVLTAERFVPDNFAAHANGRLYRTGDLVRYRTDGTLEFLGRLDHQVKVRGYRMELGEIEHVLAGAAGVRDAVVLRREDRPGDVRLVAYVRRTDASAAVDAEALRTRVRERLPEFMVPAQVVALDAFPLTPNGKIDRKALPPPESVRPVAATSGGAPETDIERTLVRIWTDLLGLPSVGVDENFFDLGGHSLLAVQALARIRDAMAESIPITDLFRFPTIRGLARHLSGAALPSAALEQAQARASKRLAARRRDPREGR
jgi:non-ribosomal peptide synthetase component F